MKKALVTKSPLGVFAFSESGDLVFYSLWDRKKSADNFLAKDLPEDFESNMGGYELIEDNKAGAFLRKHFRDYAKSLAGMKDVELNEFLSEFASEITTRKLRGVIGHDKLVVQAVRSLDDLSKTINVFTERLYEWYSLHYPEMKNANIVDTVAKHGRRSNVKGFRKSTGVDLTDEDEAALQSFAFTIQNLKKQKKDLENYVEKAMGEIARNFSSLINPLLAARMLAYAGSLEKLARMPASTIQLLGAEKALFRHLREKGRSPKYGMIFNSDIIQRAADKSKGKVARVLSSKLMLAARIDYYSGRDDTARLKKGLEEELAKV